MVGHRVGSLVALSALALTACRALEYPLPHYEDAYSKIEVEAPPPSAAALAGPNRAQVERGRYLAEILGCGGCHTEGAVIGAPDATKLFAGSGIGIAYTNPNKDTFPGVAYPANLTPDRETGLGAWTDAAIASAIRSGTSGAGAAHLRVMSWPLYRHLSDDDVSALVAYLRSIPPIKYRVPVAVPPGVRATTSYVYFGVYRSTPAIDGSSLH